MPDDDLDKTFAKDLIRKCLQGTDKKRLQTMGDVLAHPYFNSTARDEIIRKESSLAHAGKDQRRNKLNGILRRFIRMVLTQ